MITTREPAAMTSAERCAEIAETLAAGYLRLLVSRTSAQNSLDDHRQPEASCDSHATSPKSTESAA